jgi:cytochrome c554/c'-like protein
VVLVAPYGWYQVRHLRDWLGQRMTAAMALGFATLAATTTCIVSGVVLSWQSVMGPRLGPIWDLTHLISGIAVVALLVAHLVLAIAHRPGARDEVLRAARKSFAWRSGAGAVVAGALIIVIAVVVAPTGRTTFAPPPGYSMPSYADADEQYRGNPFAPSNARTATREMVNPALLSGSASCGTAGCHEEILAEWEPSAHRFAAMNPPFQAVQKAFAADREVSDTRYCAGCHDPVSLFAGAKDLANQDLSAPGMQEGISCVVCHVVSETDNRGNADYELTPPSKYLGENGQGWVKAVSDFLIRAYPRKHLADYDRNLLRTPEFCAACHKQFIPEALNGFGIVPGQNQYDEWLNGHWHSEDPETDLSCTDCHMRLVPDSRDPGHGEGGDARRNPEDGTHRHHGFIATNNFMPEVLGLPHAERHVALTEEWVRGETVLPELEPEWPRGPVASVEFVGLPESVTPGGELTVRVVIVNRKAGHNFITGPLDFVRSWVHLRLTDADGRVLVERGGIDPETRRILDRPGVPHTADGDPALGTLVLESNPVDAEGNVLERHELWRKAGGRDKRVVFPRYSDAQVYRIRVPDGAQGPLTLSADLNYRRYRQRFLDLVVPEMESGSGVYQRTITQHSVEAAVRVGSDTDR